MTTQTILRRKPLLKTMHTHTRTTTTQRSMIDPPPYFAGQMQKTAAHERREDALACMLAKDMIPHLKERPGLRERILRAAARVVKEADAHHEDALIAAHELRNAKAAKRL